MNSRREGDMDNTGSNQLGYLSSVSYLDWMDRYIHHTYDGGLVTHPCGDEPPYDYFSYGVVSKTGW